MTTQNDITVIVSLENPTKAAIACTVVVGWRWTPPAKNCLVTHAFQLFDCSLCHCSNFFCGSQSEAWHFGNPMLHAWLILVSHSTWFWWPYSRLVRRGKAQRRHNRVGASSIGCIAPRVLRSWHKSSSLLWLFNSSWIRIVILLCLSAQKFECFKVP